MTASCLVIAIACLTADDPAGVDSSDPARTSASPISVTGVVTDELGAAVGNATVYLVSVDPGYRRLATVPTDDSGRYRFTDVPLPIAWSETEDQPSGGSFDVFVIADGKALTWRDTKWYFPRPRNAGNVLIDAGSDPPDSYYLGEKIELDFVMQDPYPVRGELVDRDNQPIVGATIDVRMADRDLDPERAGVTDYDLALSCLNERKLVPRNIKTATTDEHGRFTLAHMPPDSRLRVFVHAEGFPTKTLHLVTKPGNPIVNSKGRTLYRGDLKLDLPRASMVTFQIRCQDTNEPADRVFVDVRHPDGGSGRATNRFGIVTLPVYVGESALTITPRYNTPYYRTEHEFEWYPQDDPSKTVEFTIQPAATVEFEVVDRQGDPVAGAYVWRDPIDVQLRSFQMSRQIHSFRSFEAETRLSHINRRSSDSDGRVTHFFKPGRYIIGVATGIGEYDSPPDDAPSEDVTLAPGEKKRLRFVVTP